MSKNKKTNLIKTYGDTINDGKMQLSFTLPVAESEKATEAARQYVLKLGFDSCEIVYSKSLADEFTFFVAYAKSSISVDYNKIPVENLLKKDYMDFNKINNIIKTKIKRKIIIVGACTGFDAHTVGIDSIMNMKGYNHHYGLERYPKIQAYNLGAQVKNELLIKYACEVNADAILISQIVTQKDIHIENLTEFVELLEAEGLREKFILCLGGPRIGNRLALEIGFDAGFGKGTYAEHVAGFIIKKMITNK